MTDHRIPKQVAERETTIGGYRLRVATLDDGTHVIPAEDMEPFVHALRRGALTTEHAKAAVKFVRGTH